MPVPRTPRRTIGDYRATYDAMPVRLRQMAREYFDGAPPSTMARLRVSSDDSSELSVREIVLIAEEIVRNERLLDATDDVLADMKEDYGEDADAEQ